MKKPNLKLLSRYLSSRCSDEEKSKVEAWIEANPQNKESFDRLKNIWKLSGTPGRDWDFARPIQKLSALMKKTENHSPGRDNLRLYRITPRPASSIVRPFMQIAATMVVLLGTLYAVHYLRGKALEKTAATANRSFAIEEASTKPGEQATIRFADGTKVALNSASFLRYSNDPEGSREIFLDGEAFFEVIHSDNHPFIVHAGNETIRDIGTRFDVRAWSDDNTTRVAVLEGTVSIRPNNKASEDVLLLHNQYCVVGRDGMVLPPTDADVSGMLEWMDGKLVFHDAPMSEVIKQIRRKFGLYCSVSDTSILSRRITSTFDKREPPKRVLDIIALSLNLTYKTSRDSVIFMFSKRSVPSGMTPRVKEQKTIQHE